MPDINSKTRRPPAESPGSSSKSGPGGRVDAGGCGGELVSLVELLYFAYRDFTADADDILLEYGFGRAHHRILHFVCRSPGLRVAALLDILKITKQSLAPVLKQLVDQGIIVQRAGPHDRRERLLYTTDKGKALAGKLCDLQSRRIARALEAADRGSSGPETSGQGTAAQGISDRGTDEVLRDFLFNMIKVDDREYVAALLAGAGAENGRIRLYSDGDQRSRDPVDSNPIDNDSDALTATHNKDT